MGLLDISVAAGESPVDRVLARALSLLGVDQAIEIRDQMSAGPDPDR